MNKGYKLKKCLWCGRRKKDFCECTKCWDCVQKFGHTCELHGVGADGRKNFWMTEDFG